MPLGESLHYLHRIALARRVTMDGDVGRFGSTLSSSSRPRGTTTREIVFLSFPKSLLGSGAYALNLDKSGFPYQPCCRTPQGWRPRRTSMISAEVSEALDT